VLDEAARQARCFMDAGFPLRVAINVSARQLKNEDLIEDLTAALARHRLPTGTLDIEITESCLIEDEGTAICVIEQLRALGARVHLDDFGRGYFSFYQLNRLPLDSIKLDRSFIQDCATSEKSRGLIRAIGMIAREFDFSIIAEGVETPEQEFVLRHLGIAMGQGYHFARPVDGTTLLGWLQERAAKRSATRPGPWPGSPSTVHSRAGPCRRDLSAQGSGLSRPMRG
jgi:cyclic di-GMP phosphodiesterase Gmr